MQIPGVPTREAPATDQSGVLTWDRYQGEGREGARCGSLATIGLPLEVLVPDTVQLLEAPPGVTYLEKISRSSSRRSSAVPAEVPGGVV